jgi:hypothetical protein
MQFRGKLVTELGCDVAKHSLTYLAAFDVTTFTRKASFCGDGVGDNHQFHRLVGEPLLHHSEIVKQLVNRAPWQLPVLNFDNEQSSMSILKNEVSATHGGRGFPSNLLQWFIQESLWIQPK